MNRQIQTSRSLHIRFELLKNDAVVDMLQGVAYQGSVNGNAKSTVRRTADISIVLKDYNEFLPNEKGKIWLNSEVIVKAGLEDANRTGDIDWYDLGHFMFLKFNLQRNHQGATMTCSVADKMTLLDGTLKGTLDLKTVLLPQGITIDTAFFKTLQQLAHINQNNIIIQELKLPLPYEISAAPGETVAGLFETLLNLYMGYEMFWDGDYFIVRRILQGDNDAYVWDFTKDKHGLTITNNNGIDFTNVRNKAVVYGKVSDSGVQLKTVYHNKYLRRYLDRKVYATHDEIDIPFIFDQEIGDIAHIADPQQIRELIDNCDLTFPERPSENGLQFPEYEDRFEGLVAWRNNRYARHFLSQPRSYIWTDVYTCKQYFVAKDHNHPEWTGINTGPDALVRLDYYPQLDYPITAVSLADEKAMLKLEPDFSRRCSEEGSTRFYYVKRIDPESVQSEVAQVVQGQNNQHFRLTKEIWDTVNAEVYVDGKIAKNAVKTNREHKGYIIFPEPIPSGSKVVVNYLARNAGTLFTNEDIYIEYTYKMKKSSWVELDFNVVPGFRSELLGESVIEYSSQDIFNMKQAKLRAEFELFKHSHLAETIQCESVPIYSLKENTKIKLEDKKIGIEGDYIIDTLSIPMDVKTAMQFSAHKIQVPFKVSPINRVKPPGLFKACSPSEVWYPEYGDRFYIYNFDDKVFELRQRVLGQELINLRADERNKIILFARSMLENEPIDLTAYMQKVQTMVNYIRFTNSFEKNRFVNEITKTKAEMKRMMETLPFLKTVAYDKVEMVKYRCHYVGDVDGRIRINYEMGSGNTFEKLEVFMPEDPPQELVDIDKIPSGVNACEYKYDNWPKKKPPLPPRGFKKDPIITTQNAATNGFIRRTSILGFPWKYWDYEPTIQTKVTTHFCSTYKMSYDKLFLRGQVEAPENENIRRATHKLWVGAIPNTAVPLFVSLGHGNTKERLYVKYEGKILAQVDEPGQVIEKTIYFNWQPLEGKYYVDVIVESWW